MTDDQEHNPYAPPKADVGSGTAETGLKRRRVVVMVLLLFVTLGIYYPVWFFRRRPGLNRLDSSRKLPLWPLLLFASWFAVQFVLGAIEGANPGATSDLEGLVGGLQLVIGIVMLIQCFAIKDIIEDHAQGPDDAEERDLFKPRVKLSGLMTFFFSIFYLQYAINKYAVDARPT